MLVLIPGACSLFFWITDFFIIFFEKYKIPVAIDETLLEVKKNSIDKDIESVSNLKFNKNNKNLTKNKEKKNKKE